MVKASLSNGNSQTVIQEAIRGMCFGLSRMLRDTAASLSSVFIITAVSTELSSWYIFSITVSVSIYAGSRFEQCWPLQDDRN